MAGTDIAADLAQAEELLLGGEFLDCRPVWYSSNYVYLAQLSLPDSSADNEQRSFSTIYKPHRGEAPLWDFPEGCLYKREAAAYQLARLLAWPAIPPTVVRDGPQGIGSVQLYIEHDPACHFFQQREVPALIPQLKRMAVFDIVANNADRKGGHCLLDSEDRIWGIDHGLCFHEQDKLRSVIWDWVGEPVDVKTLTDVAAAHEALVARAPETRALAELLSVGELDATVHRMERLLTKRVFPEPGPARHYPWPLV